MKKNERIKAILQIVEEQGAVSYQELEKRLHVSGMTVRRDIDLLSSKGQVIKTLGGAQRANAQPGLYESDLMSRLGSYRGEKRAIAAAALKYIKPNETIYLDGGTTCLELAKMFAEVSPTVTVLTSSLLVCMELAKVNGRAVFCIGGQLDPSSYCLTGPRAEDEAQKFFVDKAFFSTKGIIPAIGTFESSVGTFRIKQLIAKQCKEVVLLTDHSKFGQQSLCKVLDTAQLHTVITDWAADATAVGDLKARGIQVLVAEDLKLQ